MSATTSAKSPDLHVILYRRDLRVEDHELLQRVSSLHNEKPVRLVPLYVHDPQLLRHECSSTAHHIFIGDCLDDLSLRLEALGSGLIARVGHLTGVLQSLLQCNGRMTLWSHHVTGMLHERAHDKATREWCEAHSVTWHEVPTGGVWPCLQRYSFQEWLQVHAERFNDYCSAPLIEVPTQLPPLPTGLRRGQRPALEAIARLGAAHDHAITAAALQRGGSAEAHKVLRSFLIRRGRWYRSQLSSPITAASSCSRLSPHLAWGSLSVRQVHRACTSRLAMLSEMKTLPLAEVTGWREAIDGFLQRIRWRAHNMQKFEATPESELHNLVRGYDALRRLGGPVPHAAEASTSAPDLKVTIEDDGNATRSAVTDTDVVTQAIVRPDADTAEEDRLFAAWRCGKTGYPLVDACMRCLDQTGWLNFRMRCLVVSFACYHLWLHWRRPAAWLAQRFVDFEPGIHFSQVQMQAGTAEFVEMRVYNPTKQAIDQDPKGVFIRQWLPELRHVPLQFVHEPSRMPPVTQREVGCVIGTAPGASYPPPVVEHKEAYDRAKLRLVEAREAMGFPRAATRKKRAAERDCHDIGDMLRNVAARTTADEPNQQTANAETSCANTPEARAHTHGAEGTQEVDARARLSALGFPLELISRALSAYPTDVNRAADWILQAKDW